MLRRLSSHGWEANRPSGVLLAYRGSGVDAISLHLDRTAADARPQINSADVSWLLTSSALVLMMTIPGLALFYGGLVRRKNVLSTVMQSFILAGVISIEWGAVRIQSRICTRQFVCRRARMAGAVGRECLRAICRLLGDGAASGLHDLSVHVRDHHARADNGRHRGADVVSRLSDVHRLMVDSHL